MPGPASVPHRRPSARPWSAFAAMRVPSILVLCLVLLGVTAAAQARTEVDPPAGSPKFLTLPFKDTAVRLREGWYYDGDRRSVCPHPNDIENGVQRHCAMDYFKGAPGKRVVFPVHAAAEGRARFFTGGNGVGFHIIIEHDAADPTGRKFCTRYLHLVDPSKPQAAASRVRFDQWTRVERGELIATAGNSGAGEIHLHFEVAINRDGSDTGCVPNDQATGAERFDPYDIGGRLLRQGIKPLYIHYPGREETAATANVPIQACGANFLWMECPPKATPPVVPVLACRNRYDAATPVPPGFGAAYNVFTSRKEAVVEVTCNGTSGVTLRVGSGAATQYVYRWAYAWDGTRWKPTELTGATRSGDWYIGRADVALVRSGDQLAVDNFVIGLVCNWVDNRWKCGCRDAACATSAWQLQAFRRQE